MQLSCGTSGFAYKAWKGPFYPQKLADKKLLAFYAERLDAVEINNTFYRLPKPEMFRDWTTQVPAHFRFVIKASQRITHRARLGAEGDDALDYLWQTTASLGDHRGPILFQLPPYARFDEERLARFCARLPAGLQAAFEFRHASWNDPVTDRILSQHACARCIADIEDNDGAADDSSAALPELPATTDWGYLRLRQSTYSDARLQAFVTAIRAQPWQRVWVFFKHEDEGLAPALAARFVERFRRAGEDGSPCVQT